MHTIYVFANYNLHDRPIRLFRKDERTDERTEGGYGFSSIDIYIASLQLSFRSPVGRIK